MVEIDGSQGEGGGQVLRSSLALSILTGQRLEIWNIRARRTKPGLLAQHLQAVDAAVAVSQGRVEGAALGATALVFEPGSIRSGRYRFEIRTAGSTSLVLQTIFLPLSLAGGASTVVITGGTHVPHAPSFHYLDRQWLPWMQALGFSAQIHLEAAGFYPQGQGRIRATVRPAGRIAPLSLRERGPLSSLRGLSAVANLDTGIAERQKRQALRRMEARRLPPKIKVETLPSANKGTLLLLLAEFETAGEAEHPPGPGTQRTAEIRARACYEALGELGKPAERVADEAVDRLEAFLDGRGVVDQFLADQLLLPLAFAAGASEFCTGQVTQHLLTNAAVIQAYRAAHIEIQGEPGQPGLIKVIPEEDGRLTDRSR